MLPDGFGFLRSVAIGGGLALASSLLSTKPKAPKASPSDRDRLFANIDPNTPRKIVYGRTAMATDIRDQEYSGADDEYFHRFVVVASHKINAVEQIWFDDKLAWTSTGGVQGEYASYLTVTPIVEGSAANVDMAIFPSISALDKSCMALPAISSVAPDKFA